MRVLFAGTPQTAVPALEALAASEATVVGVLTRPDAPVGRKRVLTPSPVAQRAAELELPVLRAARLNGAEGEETLKAIRQLQPDLAAVVAYGAMVPAEGLEIPQHGWLNLHFSLLPAYRGAAPVQHAVIAQEAITGASVFQLETGMDTGPVYSRLEQPIAPGQTAGELLEHLSETGASLLTETVVDILNGHIRATAQEGTVSYAPKLTQQDGHIDPEDSAAAVAARINGTTPEPGAWAVLRTESTPRIKFGAAFVDDEIDTSSRRLGDLVVSRHSAHLVCRDGAVELTRVQPAGKKMMNAIDWARGLPAGTRIQTGDTL